jgi:hypothetical protein
MVLLPRGIERIIIIVDLLLLRRGMVDDLRIGVLLFRRGDLMIEVLLLLRIGGVDLECGSVVVAVDIMTIGRGGEVVVRIVVIGEEGGIEWIRLYIEFIRIIELSVKS